MTILKTRQNAVDAVEILLDTLSFPNPDPARELKLATDNMRIAAFMVGDHVDRIKNMLGRPSTEPERHSIVTNDHAVTYFIDDGDTVIETITPTDAREMVGINKAIEQDLDARTAKAKEIHAEDTAMDDIERGNCEQRR